MSEYVNTYDLNNPYQVIPMQRDEFYDEQIEVYKKTGAPTKAVDIIDVIIFNESGELIIQKRADHKKHNANLLDKSIWWHIQNGDNPNHTVMVETVQELEIPSLVVNNHTEFMRTYNVLNSYLQSMSLIQYIDTKIYTIEKIFGKEKIIIANRIHFYLWVYWGRTKNVDREAKGILLYSLESLEKEIKEYPNTFTDDLKLLIEKYRPEIVSFLQILKKDK